MSQSLTPESLLDRFDISTEDLASIKECGRVLNPKIDSVVDRFYEWLGAQPEFNVFFSSQDTVERVKKLQKACWTDFLMARSTNATSIGPFTSATSMRSATFLILFISQRCCASNCFSWKSLWRANLLWSAFVQRCTPSTS